MNAATTCQPTPHGVHLQDRNPFGTYHILLMREHRGPVYDSSGNQIGAIQYAPQGQPLSGPGTELVVMMEDAGVPSCQSCKRLALQMDWWGPQGCRDNMDFIVNDIYPRAQEWLSREGAAWVERFKSYLPGIAKKEGIKRLVLEAIKRAERTA